MNEAVAAAGNVRRFAQNACACRLFKYTPTFEA